MLQCGLQTSHSLYNAIDILFLFNLEEASVCFAIFFDTVCLCTIAKAIQSKYQPRRLCVF